MWLWRSLVLMPQNYEENSKSARPQPQNSTAARTQPQNAESGQSAAQVCLYPTKRVAEYMIPPVAGTNILNLFSE